MTLQHARLSASSSNIWMQCTKAPSLWDVQEQYENDTPESLEGRKAHEYAEKMLKREITIDEIPYSFSEHIKKYVEYCKSVAKFESVTFIENTLSYSDYVKDGFGTSDFTCYSPDTKRVEIVDLKYGEGHKVYAENNTQLMLYALSFYQNFNLSFKTNSFTLTVFQPRLGHIDSHTISLTELLNFGDLVRELADKTDSDEAVFRTGPHCLFCRSKAICPKNKEEADQIMNLDVSDKTINPKNPNYLTLDELTRVYINASKIKSWLNSVEKEIYNAYKKQGNIAGLKKVKGRSVRKWKDEKQAELALSQFLPKSDMLETKLISVAKSEKVVAKKHWDLLSNFITQEAGKDLIVSVNDRRESVENETFRQFKNEDKL